MNLLLILRVVHVLSAVILVGSIIFNYVFLRPALNKIPPAHTVTVTQRVGTKFTIIGLICLGLLLATGLTRLALVGGLNNLLDVSFYLGRYGRWLAVELLSWLVMLTNLLIMTVLLRPRPTQKLTLKPTTILSNAKKGRATQLASSPLLGRLQLINTIFGSVAALAGASLMLGGLF